MQHLLPRLWIAIAISTCLAIENSYPAIAKPKPKLTASRSTEQVKVAKNRSSRSIRELLATSSAKPAIQSKRSNGVRSVGKGTVPSRVGQIDDKSRGIGSFTTLDGDNPDRSSPVNKLIN